MNKIVYVPDNVHFFNQFSRDYYLATQALGRDLMYVLCYDVWPDEHRIMSQEAWALFRHRLPKSVQADVTPIEAGAAAKLSDWVMVEEDIEALFYDVNPKNWAK